MSRAVKKFLSFGAAGIAVAAISVFFIQQSIPDRHGVQTSHLAPAPGSMIVSQQLSFEVNRGQSDGKVKFLSRGRDYTLFLTADETVLTLRAPDHDEEPAVLRMQLRGANPEPSVNGEAELAGKRHYFIGNDPAQWHRDIPTYGKVRYRDVYPGIDLLYYGKAGLLEYDFILRPGADPDKIRLAFKGAERISVDHSGNLVLHTAVGDVIHRVPLVYQDLPEGRREIQAEYRVTDDVDGPGAVFRLAAYDTSFPLIIDPALSYSSFLGGSSVDEGNAVAVDASGNFYVTGGTLSTNFPGDNGGYAPHVGGVSTAPTQVLNNPSDAFVSKYDSAGTLLFSVYLGSDGVLGDAGNGIAVDAAGNIYVTGYTTGSFLKFPTTSSAYSQNHVSSFDVFVTELASDGASLVYSTLIGGGKGDIGEGIAVDATGNIYVAGTTFSDGTFPTKNAYQSSGDGNASFSDGFVLKIDPTQSGAASLFYSTFLGGSSVDEINAIAVDGVGDVFVTGQTLSSDFPLKNAGQASFGGAYDAFVAELNTTGSALIYSTFLGGSGSEAGNGIALDGTGNAYIVGVVAAQPDGAGGYLPDDFPVTSGAYAAAIKGGSDAFVAKLDTVGTKLYASYLGGSGGEEGRAIAVDGSGNTYITGWTDSSDFPSINVTIQSGNAGSKDAFIAKLTPAGNGQNDLLYAGYLGGAGDDMGNGIAVDGKGNAYVTGWTETDIGFSYTQDASQTSFGGGARDAFVARIGPFADLGVALVDNDATLNGTLTYSVILVNNGPDLATGIVATVTLPATGVTYVSADAGCTPDGSGLVVTCDMGNLAVNGQKTVNINTTVATTDAVTATVSVVANEADYPQSVSANNTASQVTIATAAGDTDPNDSNAAPSQSPPPFIVVGTPPSLTATTSGGGGGAIDPAGALAGLFALGVAARRRRVI